MQCAFIHLISSNSATAQHEMCNFYLMYYLDSGEPLKKSECMSFGPPTYYWKNDKQLQNIPDEDASRLDDIPDNNIIQSSSAVNFMRMHAAFFLISLFAVLYHTNFMRF